MPGRLLFASSPQLFSRVGFANLSTSTRVLCTLCSTTFNGSRVRTLDEPKEASWAIFGPGIDSWPNADHQMWPCSTQETGCKFYVPSDLHNSKFCQEDEQPMIYFHHFCSWPKETLPVEGDWIVFDPNAKPVPGALSVYLEDIEHVAGPGCRHTGAYNGNRITWAEMRGCQTIQCLVPKSEDWEPASDDQDFERDSEFFLSGIATRACSRVEPFFANPVRHGVEEIVAGCPALDTFDADEDHLPFHPWCFGTWIKLTKLHLGFVRSPSFSANLVPLPPLDRSWVHNPGDEWLAANPFYAPQLRGFLEEARNVSPSFTPHDSAFCSSAISCSSPDVFACLSADLRLLILLHLATPDIASIRQASRTFYHLPVSLWYRLLRQEMPWLWEIWTDEPPYFWATVTEQDLLEHESEGFDVYSPFPYGSEGHLVVSHTINVEKHLEPWTYPKPPRHRTNWFVLYRCLKETGVILKAYETASESGSFRLSCLRS
ncbi:hypothetical protein BJX65DRAFT_297232 [Aspergillus insuetus]